MKNLLFVILFLTACFSTNGNDVNIAYDNIATQYQQDPLLANIQNKIMAAFVQDFMGQTPDTQALAGLDAQLVDLGKQKPSNLIQYWRAYNHYYQAICYIKKDNKAASEKAINQAIDLLDELRNKNSEDYALLSLAQGFSIQFKGGMGAGITSAKAKTNGEKATSADPNNLRAYFVLGSNDFYTPKQYGGGKKAENYLLKAISLPEQATPNAYLPSWGKDQAYAMLIELYLQKGDKEKAKEHFKTASDLFPDNYQISQLAKKLI
jgi:tetratricopeptide (TPR) repeat protein